MGFCLPTMSRAPPEEVSSTSMCSSPGKSCPSGAASATAGVASGKSVTSMTRCDRAAYGPGRPLGLTCRRTRVRHPVPSSLPGMASTVVSVSMPAMRLRESASTWRLSSRWCSIAMWPNSAPPARSAGSRSRLAADQMCGWRNSLGVTTRTVSARQNDFFDASETRATTVSPGIASLTNTTLPSCRATEIPPCATLVTSSSSSVPLASLASVIRPA